MGVWGVGRRVGGIRGGGWGSRNARFLTTPNARVGRGVLSEGAVTKHAESLEIFQVLSLWILSCPFLLCVCQHTHDRVLKRIYNMS